MGLSAKLGTTVGPHLSGCRADCPAPLHLTLVAVQTLIASGVPDQLIEDALEDEPRLHTRTDETAQSITPRHLEILATLGVPASETDRLDSDDCTRSSRSVVDWAHSEAARTAAWKARNPGKNAEYQRAYRARQREKLKLVTGTD